MTADPILRLPIAPATSENPRNSEADIIELADGRLLLGWTEFYAGNSGDEGAARLVGRVSDDGGVTWGNKYTLVENDGACNVMEINFVRLGSGGIALLYCQKNAEIRMSEAPDCRVMLRVSTDEGRTFGPARELTGQGRYIETANGRGLRLRGGRLLLECDDIGSAFCLWSDDDGQTWHERQHVRPKGDECWEPRAVELRNGRVLMFLRTRLGGQYQTWSDDGGETWSEPELSALVGSPAPVAVERIPATGDLLAIWNHDVDSPRPRTPLTTAISRDEGETWEELRDLESAKDNAFAYPAVTFVGEVALVTYFDYRHELSLWLARVPVGWFYGK